MAYTIDQMKQFINDKGIGSNPYAIYSYATSPEHQKNINLADLDAAVGGPVGTSSTWMMQQGLNNPWREPSAPPTMPSAGGPPPSRPQNPYSLNPTNSNTQPMAQPQMPQTMPGSQSMPGYQPNPYTRAMMGNITQAVTQNLNRNIFPGIRRGQVANGTLGSTRQGIAEGIAIGDTNQALANAATNLYGNQFNADRSYGLQSDALDLNVYNANQNWMRQGQQDQLGLMDRMLGWQNMGLQNATNVQNTPFNYWQGFVNPATQMAGLGGTQSQQMQGNPYLTGIGGAVTGMNLYNQFMKGG